MSTLRQFITGILSLPLTLLAAVLCGLGTLTFTKRVPSFFMRSWGKTLMLLGGITLDIKGMENVDSDRPAIYMANHASMMDIPILAAALPVDLRFIFKKSILYIPILGAAIWAMRMIPIDRSNRAKASQSLKKAGDIIRSGFHLLVFPEGTRTRTGELLPFKKGGFFLALQEHIDIIPVTIRNSAVLCGRSAFWARSGVIDIVIHERISCSEYGMEDRREVVGLVRDMIARELSQDCDTEVAA